MRSFDHASKAGLAASLAILLVAGASNIASAATIYYVPQAGGFWSSVGDWSLGRLPGVNDDTEIIVSGNAHKAVDFDMSSAGVETLTIDGGGAFYGALWHLGGSLLTDYLYLGDNGEAWHWMEDDAFLWALQDIHIGHDDPGPGHFYLDVVDYGVLVNGDSYVGYCGPGDFDHRNGYHNCSRLIVGQNAPGTYWLKGPQSTSTLSTEYWATIGNADVGLFEQTGGTFDVATTLMLGVNTGGEGTYLMKGGVLNAYYISIAYDGDGYFTQSGGTITTESDINIGCDGTHPHMAWYKINDDDDDPELNIGGGLKIGVRSLGKYVQESGTVTVDGKIEIWKGTTSPSSSSYLYMGLHADWLEAAAVINHDGYFDQDGGTLSTLSFTNNSPQGVNLDNNADLQARHLTNTDGTVWMYRNAILRGTYAGGGIYNPCDFTNAATFQMGAVAADGGSFRGNLTNNGTFNYYQGDFSTSTLVNNGTFNMNADFTCRRLVNGANVKVYSGRTLTADGAGYANAIENNHNLVVYNGGTVTLAGDKPLVNNDNAYVDGAITGNVLNNDYFTPSDDTSATGWGAILGDYTQASSGQLRIKLAGLAPGNDYDRLSVTGTANLAGKLDVRLGGGFVPELGNFFHIVTYNGRVGQFNPVSLPTLPSGREWQLSYLSTGVKLTVVEPSLICAGDLNCDGQIDFGDINPFVLALSNWAAWQAQYPDCPPKNADINGDGQYGGPNGFGDINPFVALLASGGGQPIPCP